MFNFLISYRNEILSTNKFQEYRILLNFYNQPEISHLIQCRTQ